MGYIAPKAAARASRVAVGRGWAAASASVGAVEMARGAAGMPGTGVAQARAKVAASETRAVKGVADLAMVSMGIAGVGESVCVFQAP